MGDLLVHVYELVRNAEGRIIALGNSREVPVAEAVRGIKRMELKAATAPIGVVPAGWRETDEEAVAAEEAAEDDEF